MSAIETRGVKRDSLFLMVELQPEGTTEPEKVKIRNLSDTGILVDAASILDRGDRVIVKLKTIGPVAGRVAWTQGVRVGISFDAPIDSQAARQQVRSENTEAPRYARPAVAPRSSDWRVRPL